MAGVPVPMPASRCCTTYCGCVTPARCRLDEVGYGVGLRLLEVLAYRERGQRRETRLLDMLKFVHRCVLRWRAPSLRTVWALAARLDSG